MAQFLKLALVLAAAPLWAQERLAITIDPSAARRPISRDIYGINEYGDADGEGRLTTKIGRFPFTVRRWGGDNSVSYNWKLDANNTASNWFFETFPLNVVKDRPVDPEKLPAGSSFDQWVERNQANGLRSVATVPIIGWTTATRTPKLCSYDVRKYGEQQRTDVWAAHCGNGIKPDGRTPIVNDPNDVYIEVGPDFAGDWVRHVVGTFGTAGNGGVWMWELDNEPTWWHAVHRDIHPQHATFAEVLDRNIRWAQAIKDADPTAKIGGATPPGWESYFYSARDLYAGWSTGPDWKYWNNPVDCRQNSEDGNCLGFIPWYLRKMREHEEQNGRRLIDYLDIHAYVGPDGMPGQPDPNRPELETLRMTSTRTFWDPEYMPPRDDMRGMDRKWGTGTPQIIPRMRRWIDEHYPGTRLAITEYSWGAPGHMSGAIALADLLGIFGREGVDLATLWDVPRPDQPAAFAFRMFLDYDGGGAAFGETSIAAASPDPDRVSVFAAERADGVVTVLLLNKTREAQPVTLGGFDMAGAAVWQFTGEQPLAILRRDDLAIAGGAAHTDLPPLSITMVEVRRP